MVKITGQTRIIIRLKRIRCCFWPQKVNMLRGRLCGNISKLYDNKANSLARPRYPGFDRIFYVTASWPGRGDLADFRRF